VEKVAFIKSQIGLDAKMMLAAAVAQANEQLNITPAPGAHVLDQVNALLAAVGCSSA
jgi:hypothetical protein